MQLEKQESLHDDMDTHGENVIENAHLDNPVNSDDHTLKIVKLGAGGDDQSHVTLP
jgi:hypothetical protein